MLSYIFTIKLLSKCVIAAVHGLFRASAHKNWQVSIPIAPVNQPSAGHFVSSQAVSRDEVRKWAGLRPESWLQPIRSNWTSHSGTAKK